MVWINFPVYATITIVLWAISIVFYSISIKKQIFSTLGSIFVILGLGVFIAFIAILWTKLDRPPLRTLGETRLWYSLFLPFIGIITYIRWRYKWFISYSLGMAILFLILNLAHPENYDKTLMPALQSPWFVPHVVVYIFAYALLAASSLVALKGLYLLYFKEFKDSILKLADNLVYIGFAFLTLGLIFGALWAKEAWGHYWTWDPKETWAFLTWMGYMIYMHYRYHRPANINGPIWTLTLAFVILLIAWFGVNYLPSAQSSVHVYSG